MTPRDAPVVTPVDHNETDHNETDHNETDHDATRESLSPTFDFVEQSRTNTSRWLNDPGLDSERSVPDDDGSADVVRPRSRSNQIPAVLISMIIHTSLLIALCLLTLPASREQGNSLTMRLGEPAPAIQLDKITLKPLLDNPFDAANNQPIITEQLTPLESIMTVPVVSMRPSESTAPIEKSNRDLAIGGDSTGSGLRQLPSGGGLSGRLPDRREEVGKKNGATPETENAVDLALEYLARHQRRDGSWSFNLQLAPCNGRCNNSREGGSGTAPSTAATGLALLAFLGRGYTHENENPYRENVRRGIYFLRAIAAQSEAGYDWQEGSMYAHAIALMALSEALTMTSPSTTSGELVNENAIDYQSDDLTLNQRARHELYPLVSRGANFTCIAQHSHGSWGYHPGRPGDTTMTGWHVLSLIAAKRNGVPLHSNTLMNAKEFVFSTQGEHRFRFGYQGPPAEPTTTAVGLTLMLYLGETIHNPSLPYALQELVDAGPKPNNIYHNYYASLALHHAQHPAWDQWNAALQKRLLSTQETGGHEKGSWHFKDKHGNVGGRLYTTAMCALTLEVYYRYMPLYQTRDSEFPL